MRPTGSLGWWDSTRYEEVLQDERRRRKAAEYQPTDPQPKEPT